MKKFLFAAIAVLFALSLSAQDIKKIRSAYDKKDWAKAKEAVDLALATEKEQKKLGSLVLQRNDLWPDCERRNIEDHCS